MHLDWVCPNCNEKHISKIKPIDIGDEVSLECSNCNVDIFFEVKQKKFFLTYKGNNPHFISNDAIAWE
ncbi:hypothetical protein [Virgibacillus halodenitrificans]|uniref:hypothetical protein n=1 Tax=Virgibacillus halodenitrificans TaxID=1482 RepID=UPI002DC02BA4|nr:hypothetical protein [Virgibacillus halodenitrificans]MEC2157667.1 hypothetical protein [Virgibacillus halodenitrificans]